MEKIEFVKSVIALYENNCRIDPVKHSHVIRGRGRTISSETEDLFGIYVSELLGDDYTVYIDTRISVGGDVFFPDVTICKGEQILQMWDLKMDLGWMRGKLWDMIDKNKTKIEKIKSKKVDSGTKYLEGYAFAEDVTYNFAIITLCNGGKDAEEVYKHAISEENNDSASKVFFIFKHTNMKSGVHEGYHPNCGLRFKDDYYDLVEKMSYGKFKELEQFILALKSNHINDDK